MVGDLPTATVDAGAVEREAAEAAQAAADAAAEINDEVRAAEAQVSAGPSTGVLGAAPSTPPSAVLGESTQDRRPERA